VFLSAHHPSLSTPARGAAIRLHLTPFNSTPTRRDETLKKSHGGDDEKGRQVVSAADLEPVRWIKPNVFQQLVFAQATPLISRGQVRRLEPHDLCRLPEMESQALWHAFERDWAEERERNPDNPSLVRACLKGSRPTFVGTGILYAIAQASLFSGPVLLQQIVKAIECRRVLI